jgi:hypothetical protein
LRPVILSHRAEATRLGLRHAFEALGLDSVEPRVTRPDRRALGCHERCGLVREGLELERDTVFVDGTWASAVRPSIPEHDYRRLRPAWEIRARASASDSRSARACHHARAVASVGRV